MWTWKEISFEVSKRYLSEKQLQMRVVLSRRQRREVFAGDDNKNNNDSPPFSFYDEEIHVYDNPNVYFSFSCENSSRTLLLSNSSAVLATTVSVRTQADLDKLASLKCQRITIQTMIFVDVCYTVVQI